MEDLISDFDSMRSKVLLLRMDDKCYQLNLSYVPFLEITDFVSVIDHLDSTFQFILFSSDEYDAIQNILVTVYKSEGEKFRIQTLYIKVSRVFPSDISKYEEIFPSSPEGKVIQPKNIKRLLSEVKSFAKF